MLLPNISESVRAKHAHVLPLLCEITVIIDYYPTTLFRLVHVYVYLGIVLHFSVIFDNGTDL